MEFSKFSWTKMDIFLAYAYGRVIVKTIMKTVTSSMVARAAGVSRTLGPGKNFAGP